MSNMIDNMIINSSFLCDLGLFHGKIGISLFFFVYSRLKDEKIYNVFALELLDEVLECLHDRMEINFESGLSGIGWAICYLIDNKYIEGDKIEILRDLDDVIMRSQINKTDYSLETGLLGLYTYVETHAIGFSAEFKEALVESIPRSQLRSLDDILYSIPLKLSYDEACCELGLRGGCAGYSLLNISL